MTPQDFVAKWKKTALKESASSQTHFNELCRLIDHPIPTDADPKGEWFTFEAGVEKVAGGQGWADVWKKGYFPWPPGDEPADDPRVEAIAQAARELVEKRQAWLHPEEASEKELKKRTLTNLYNEYPTWLELVHGKLDRAVLDAYGWPHDLTDEEILERASD